MILNFMSGKHTINFINNLRCNYYLPVKEFRHGKIPFYRSFYSSCKSAFQTGNFRVFARKTSTNVVKVNTNVQNNVILYKNEHNRDFIIIKVVFYGWLFCNMALVFGTYNPKYISSWSKDLSWVEYIKTNGSNVLYFGYAICVGPLFCAALYFMNQRFIKYVVLHKGGKEVSIITNHLYKGNNSFKVSIDQVKTTVSRDKMTGYLPLKIRNEKLYYIMDRNGIFPNGLLFDYTVGAAKPWK